MNSRQTPLHRSLHTAYHQPGNPEVISPLYIPTLQHSIQPRLSLPPVGHGWRVPTPHRRSPRPRPIHARTRDILLRYIWVPGPRRATLRTKGVPHAQPLRRTRGYVIGGPVGRPPKLDRWLGHSAHRGDSTIAPAQWLPRVSCWHARISSWR